MHGQNLLALLGITVFILGGCSDKKSLSREQAASMLTTANLNVHQVLYKDSSPQGCLMRNGFLSPSQFFIASEPVPSAEGKKFIETVQGNFNGTTTVTFSTLVFVKLQGVTGITETAAVAGGATGPIARTVDFLGQMDFPRAGIPAAAQNCFEVTKPFTGHAEMTLYDDGWRLASWSMDPIVLSTAAKQ